MCVSFLGVSLFSRTKSGKIVLKYDSPLAVVRQCNLLEGCVKLQVNVGAVKLLKIGTHVCPKKGKRSRSNSRLLCMLWNTASSSAIIEE